MVCVKRNNSQVKLGPATGLSRGLQQFFIKYKIMNEISSERLKNNKMRQLFEKSPENNISAVHGPETTAG